MSKNEVINPIPNIDELKEKLRAGKNEQEGGYQKFATGQFYENLTREQYLGSRQTSLLSAHRDVLNPAMNLEILKHRLERIHHYKYRFGADHTFWVHAVLRNGSTHLYRYKFNYLFKAYLAY